MSEKAYQLARAEIGTVEWAQGSNPKVVAYYRDAGHPEVVDDSVAWCAAFVGAMMKRAGHKGTGQLTARSYLNWGKPVSVSDWKRGDIGIIPRGGSAWQGHVFFVEKIEGGKVYALGGNQRDSVNVTPYPVSSLLGLRRVVDRPSIAPNPVDVIKPPVAERQTFWAWLKGWF